jgi:hypothetical protein
VETRRLEAAKAGISSSRLWLPMRVRDDRGAGTVAARGKSGAIGKVGSDGGMASCAIRCDGRPERRGSKGSHSGRLGMSRELASGTLKSKPGRIGATWGLERAPESSPGRLCFGYVPPPRAHHLARSSPSSRSPIDRQIVTRATPGVTAPAPSQCAMTPHRRILFRAMDSVVGSLSQGTPGTDASPRSEWRSGGRDPGAVTSMRCDAAATTATVAKDECRLACPTAMHPRARTSPRLCGCGLE